MPSQKPNSYILITNAITLAAKKEETWEKSVELEKLGGHLISLPIEEFKSLDG